MLEARVEAGWRTSGFLLSRGRSVASGAFVIVVALAAGVAGIAVVTIPPASAAATGTTDLHILFSGLALAAGFLVARLLAIEVDVRRDSARITPTEIPLVVGLLLLPGPIVLAAYVGVVVIARLYRRDTWTKLLFNVSYATLTVALTDLLFRLALFTWREAPPWSAVLAGFVIAHAITSALTWAFVVLLDRRRPGEGARPVVHVYLTGLLSAVLGLAAVEIGRTGPGGWVLVGVLTVIVVAVYHAYYGLLREQRDLGVLNDLSLRVAVAGQGEDENRPELDEGSWSAAMEVAREQLNATRVVLHWIPGE
ncbi:MAG: hypothetical protein ACRD0H_21195, partial [Actinomycetes bacterium]